MATKLAAQAEAGEEREEVGDGPLMDAAVQAVKKMIVKGKERGYVTYDELNATLPQGQVSSEQIEDVLAQLNEMGINVVEAEESDDGTGGEDKAGPVKPAAAPAVQTTTQEEDLGRTDDPVRMYLREMGSVELLSREGEIAIAKRIEAGREKMIGSICESPLTIRAIIEWRDSLKDERILLRDIIDLDATYGAGPDAAAPADGAATPGGNGVGMPGGNGAATPADGANGGRCQRRRCVNNDGAAATAGAQADGAATGEQPATNGADDKTDDEEDTSLSLAAMEAKLKPEDPRCCSIEIDQDLQEASTSCRNSGMRGHEARRPSVLTHGAGAPLC